MIKKTKIEVKNFSKIIGTKQILNNVSFTLDPEEHLVIIGSSGAGKSMLVKCMLGLENLSIGMSADYIEAINYKATHVRIGSSIFGKRN